MTMTSTKKTNNNIILLQQGVRNVANHNKNIPMSPCDEWQMRELITATSRINYCFISYPDCTITMWNVAVVDDSYTLWYTMYVHKILSTFERF
jgi:hypothetical protein